MNDEAVVPLRPGFDNEFRGFNRKQVIEHIELLEDQVKMLTTDRDEAMRLNEDQRRITDETRHQLDETTAELRRIETSETGMPQATRRMQNMLMMADEEANTIREHARRDAETIRGTASTDAEHTRHEAEARANALRQECAGLVTDLEHRREQLEKQHSSQTAEIESRREQLRRSAEAQREETMTAAHQEATELLRRTQLRCEEMESASQEYHASVLEDLEVRAAKLEQFRLRMLETLGTMSEFSESSRAMIDQEIVPMAWDETQGLGESGDDVAEYPGEARQQPRIPLQAGYDGAQGGHGQLAVSAVTDDDIHEDIPVSAQSRQHAGAGQSARPAEQRS